VFLETKHDWNHTVLFAFTRFLALTALLALGMHAQAQTDPLPSWNDGPAKQAIITFVEETTTQGSPKFVPPAERIATFDQDGTLWVEHPMYSQVMYILESVPALVKAKPELAKVAPYSTVLEDTQRRSCGHRQTDAARPRKARHGHADRHVGGQF
jgi:hypothetical protein